MDEASKMINYTNYTTEFGETKQLQIICRSEAASFAPNSVEILKIHTRQDHTVLCLAVMCTRGGGQLSIVEKRAQKYPPWSQNVC